MKGNTCIRFGILIVLLGALALPATAQKETSAVEKAAAQLEEAMDANDVEAASEAVSAVIGAYIDAKTDSDKEDAIAALAGALRFHEGKGRVIQLAAQGLGGMGEDAAKPLAGALNDRKLRKEESLRPAYLACIRALGQTKSRRQVKDLLDLLNDKDFEVIAAAADALGHYDSETDLRIRRKVAEELIKTLTSAYSAAEADQRNTTLQRKYEVIGTPIMVALQNVTGASVGSPPEWRKWFNDNKRKRWD